MFARIIVALRHLVTARYLIAAGDGRADTIGMGSTWTVRDIPDQTGRRVVVTGGNSGIGWHTALEFAGAGAEVTIASRNAGRASAPASC